MISRRTSFMPCWRARRIQRRGSKGLSLFIVPKFLVNADGSLGARNDIRCLKLEEKLGIHASPTCVLSYGDDGGAIGTLIGEEGRGIEYMFLMMNGARLNVGLQGVAIAERAYQQARDYALSRVQGRPITATGCERSPIIHHPDVRRMLLGMRSDTEATRALLYYTAGQIDRARHEPDAGKRAQYQARVESADPDRESLEHGAWLRGRVDEYPSAWRHGLHRGDRRGAASARRAHRADL